MANVITVFLMTSSPWACYIIYGWDQFSGSKMVNVKFVVNSLALAKLGQKLTCLLVLQLLGYVRKKNMDTL